MRYSRFLAACALAAAMLATAAAAAEDQHGLKAGPVELTAAGPMIFGPDGVLFVADTAAPAVYAIQTDDDKADASSVKVNIEKLPAHIAKTLGVNEDEVKVNDLAVNPDSGSIYISVAAGKPAKGALVKIDVQGKLSQVSLKNVPHAKAAITDAPDSQQGRRGNPRDDAITDLAFREGKLLVSGLAKGQAPSTVREFTFPFGEGATATTIEIFHAAHGRVEDNAAVRAFVPLQIDGEPALLAGFTCTPLVRFPVKSLEPGKKVRGTTVAELGNRNKPLDMVVYKKDGKSYVLMANTARGVMKISLENIKENPGLTEPVRGGGTAGQSFETIQELKGVEQLDLLNESSAVILAKADDGSLNLSTIALP